MEAPQPSWSADFAISRTIGGVVLAALDQNNQHAKATVYASNSLTPSASDQCYSLSLNFMQHFTCNKSG